MQRAAFAALATLGIAFGASCILPDVDVVGRPCPCADGYVCDEATNRCVEGGAGAGPVTSGTGATGPGTGGQGTGASGPGGGGSGTGGAQPCTGGLLDCDADPATCETNPDTDLAHCGGCNQPCSLANVATPACSGGTCDYDVCSGLFHDCDDDRTNGCERPTDTLTDCGGCGVACSPSNVTGPTCAGGTCGYGACGSAQYGDCDGDESNGCERDLFNDLDHCGSCNAGCNFACTTGQCAKTVFVTSQMWSGGSLGGIAGADAKCQAAATAAGLKGTFYAWLSDDTSTPSTHFIKSTTPYRLVDGTTVANSFADLTDGSIAATITVTELGGAAPIGTTNCAGGGFTTVYTNTTPQGTQSNSSLSCTNWTSDAPSSAWGQATDVGSWSAWCSGGSCAWLSPIYCFQQ